MSARFERTNSVCLGKIDLSKGKTAPAKIPNITDLASLSQHLPIICSSIFAQLGSQETEATYQRCLKIELEVAAVKEVLLEPEIHLMYKGRVVGTRRADLVLLLQSGEKAVLELKAVDKMATDHMKQLEFYMHHMDIDRGYLINFPHDAFYAAVDDKSTFAVRDLNGLVEKFKHLLLGTGPTLRPRNSPEQRKVEVLELSRKSLTPEERERKAEQKQKEATTRPPGKFGVNQKGEWCQNCIKQQRFCNLHRDQE